MSLAHNILTSVGDSLKSPFADAKVYPVVKPAEPFFFTLLPRDLQVHILLEWVVNEECCPGDTPRWLRLSHQFIRSTIAPMDKACSNRALREPFLQLIRFIFAKCPIRIGYFMQFHSTKTDENAMYAKMYSHVQWLLKRGIASSCDSADLPSHPAAVRALEKLADDGERIVSVRKAWISLPAAYGGVLRLFPNCTSFSASVLYGTQQQGDAVSQLNEFASCFPHIKLHDLSIYAWSFANNGLEMPNMASHVKAYSATMRTISMTGHLIINSTPTDELVSALCYCKLLNSFTSYGYPISSAHLLQLLNSCQLLVNLSVGGSRRHSLSLAEILWFSRSGSQLKSLALATGHDKYDQSLSDDDEAVMEHLKRLIVAHNACNRWETVEVGSYFRKCSAEKSITWTFSSSSASLFRDHAAEIAQATRSQHNFTVALSIDEENGRVDEALPALAEFHEALGAAGQPIKVDLYIVLPTLREMTRNFGMVCVLNIHTENATNDSDVLQIVTSCPHLVEVDLSSWNDSDQDEITDTGVCALFAGCSSLKTVSFGNVSRVTNRSLHAILEYKIHINTLEFKHANITNKDIESFRQLAVHQQLLPVPTIIPRARW